MNSITSLRKTYSETHTAAIRLAEGMIMKLFEMIKIMIGRVTHGEGLLF